MAQMLSQSACWMRDYLFGTSQLLWGAFHLCVCLFFFAVVLVLNQRQKRTQPPKGHGIFLFCLFYFILLLLWIPNFARPELNPDESQWIAEGNNFSTEPFFWISYFLPTNLTRILTILPLGLLGRFTGGLDYEAARAIGLLMWSGIATCFYSGTRLVFGYQPALTGAALLVITFGRLSMPDFVAFNSELPLILLGMIAYASGIRAATQEKGLIPSLVTGLCIAAMPFAKEQGLPIAALLGLGVGCWFCYLHQWRNLGGLAAGALFWFISVITILAFQNNFGEWLAVLRVWQDYAEKGVSQDDSFLVRRLGVFKYILLYPDIRFLILAACFSWLWLGGKLFCGTWRPSNRQLQVAMAGPILFFAAVFSVSYPGQVFLHYGLLLVLPCALSLGPTLHSWLQSRSEQGRGADIFSVFLAVLFVLNYTAGHDALKSDLAQCGRPGRENFFSEKIRSLTSKGDRMMIWGWRNSYFVETGLLPGSRWMYPSVINDSFSTKSENLSRYSEDMDRLSPKVILEWVGKDSFYFTGSRAIKLAEVPDLGMKLRDRYQLVAVEGNQRLYLRKSP